MISGVWDLARFMSFRIEPRRGEADPQNGASVLAMEVEVAVCGFASAGGFLKIVSSSAVCAEAKVIEKIRLGIRM